jgi:5S rRNA maturation endonuclease (ribonuclease M5)
VDCPVNGPDADAGEILQMVLGKLDGVKQERSYWKALCPAHADSEPSLDVMPGREQPVVLICRANCATDDVLSAIGLTMADICEPQAEKPRGEWTPRGTATAVYSYCDEAGEILYQVLRAPNKQFPTRIPDSSAPSGWSWRLGDTRRVLYQLPALRPAIDAGQVIYVVEGEKDVHSVMRAGQVATCNPHGAGKWLPEFSEMLRDANVVIVADADKPGRAHAHQVADSLAGIAASVEIREAAEGKDVTNHLEAGRTLAELLVTVDSSPDVPAELAMDLLAFVAEPDPPEVWVIPGLLEHGDRLIWTGWEGLGKAQSVTTPILTVKGWSTMGDLEVGDEIFAADGSVTRVNFVTPVMTGHDCFLVRFSDGAEIVADADHLWLTETLYARQAADRYDARPPGQAKRGTDQRHKRVHFPAVVTTRQIRDTLTARNGHASNHSIETCRPLQYPAQELPVDPYLLGAWLGDGHSHGAQLSSHQDEVGHWVAEISRSGFIPTVGSGHSCPLIGITCAPGPGRRDRSFTGMLRRLGVLGNKHIPDLYLHGSAEQRLALLQGLMDTDGTVGNEGGNSGRGRGAATCEFSVTSEPLARGAHELLISLGIKVTFREGRAVLNGRDMGIRYRLAFQTELPVFRLPRKAERLTPLRTRRAKLRYITAVEPVPSVPVRCIQVEHPDHLYLVGRECIPTHNTMVTRQIGVAAAAGVQPFDPRKHFEPQRVLFIDCENRVRRSRSKFRGIVGVCNAKFRKIDPGMFRIVHRPDGLNLLKTEDQEFVLERVTAYKPDLIVIGPLYKLHDIDSNEEHAARAIVRSLEAALAVCDSALILEAHAGHGVPRSLRPRGSSLFMGWPDYGYGIRKVDEADKHRVKVIPWRGPRDDTNWPQELIWGSATEFPWVVPMSALPPQPPEGGIPIGGRPDWTLPPEDDGPDEDEVYRTATGSWPEGTNGAAENK